MKLVFRYARMVMRFLSLFIILAGCASQKQLRPGIVPPGTVQLNDTLFIDETETANIHWREYVFYLLDVSKDTVGYQNALPDTLVWDNTDWKPDTVFNNDVLLNNPFQQYYFRHPMFNSRPVVGISYEQAVEYCRWRTYAANQGVYFKVNKIEDPKMHLQDKFPIRFIYRLPTKEEWEKIALAGIDSSSKWFKKYNKKELFSYNTKECIDARSKKTDGLNPHPAITKSFYVSKSGTYNMIGNVAEMIAEKGIAKGGSFAHSLDSCNTTIDLPYSKPENWLGFRCVAVLIK